MHKLFIARLKELQGSRSVLALAKYLEMPQKTVDCYVNGINKPSVELVMRVSTKFHVTADWLLGLSDVREPLQVSAPPLPTSRSAAKERDRQVDLMFELDAIKRRLRAQELQLAAMKELSAVSTCCG